MNTDTTTRGFIAVELSKDMTATLATAQHSLRTQAKSENVKVQFVPKAVLYLPLEDLGRPEDPSYEAATLAVKRAVKGCSPFIIGLTQVKSWQEEAQCQQILAMVDDSEGGLTRIRENLLGQLRSYGFPVSEGTWSPHIPLARIPDGELALEEGAIGSSQSMRVESISIIHRTPTLSGNMRFQVRSRVLLTEAGSRDGVTLDDAARTEEIAAELSERLSQRKSTFSGRKRKRNRELDEGLEDGLDESLDEEISSEE